ncbi:hypothetical protein B7R21_08600 [Subtercola boreus]|uniref:HTH marR-type domain-containing protein n=1 Tax=Subtercola boreus TaxID=120213 RepID=A0A3E0VV97_9MICO|nr:MarR family transcriptional regulator [Subtercola boreus]RFA13263.1 hypothetical protein B7R21_08600 [Subtercola boreus]
MAAEFSVSRDDIDDVAAWTVIRAARQLARMLALELAPMELSPVEFGVLAQLADSDGLSQAELARSVGVRPQSMTALCAALESRGLLARGPDRGRGRLSRIRLTEEGRALLARAYPRVLASNDWFGEDTTRLEVLRSTLRPMLGTPGEPVPDVP